MLKEIIPSVYVALLFACTNIASASEEHAAIEKLYEQWRNAVENSSITGYVDVLHNDISLRPPGVTGLDGKQNYATFLEPVFASAIYDIQIDSVPTVTLLGSSAIVEYDYTITRTVVDESVTELAAGALQGTTSSAHYIDIVALDEAGHWKVRLHSWSDGLAPAR